eukprot:6211068-Pleurochrysis_carterae.AAC.3
MSADTLPEPKSYLRLRPRPDHSNYAECDECKTRRLAVENLIRSSAPRADINIKRSEQMAHVQEMLAERQVIAELLENEAFRSKKAAFCCDDKLGSQWQFLPMPPNERKSKKGAGKWMYRQCLQGNSYEGIGNFLSIVPPMLHTGGSFWLHCILLLTVSLDYAVEARRGR